MVRRGSMVVMKSWSKYKNIESHQTRGSRQSQKMASQSLISTIIFPSPFSRSPNTSTTKSNSSFYLSKTSLPLRKSRTNTTCFIINSSLTTTTSTVSKVVLFTKRPLLSSALDSVFIFCSSVVLSLTLFLTGVDPASAFVVTPPRKLQTDELATVRLFQENTPSVVYITNLAVKYSNLLSNLAFLYFCFSFSNLGRLLYKFICRQDAFTLDVLEVPQGSGSGFVWDKNGHVVTNYHVIRGASDLKLVFFL